MNGNLIEDKIEIIQTEPLQKDEEETFLTPTATPTKEKQPEKITIVETKVSTDELKDAEILADSFVVTPDYIQQSM